MRSLIIAAAILAAPLAQADECRNHYEAAKGVMEHRQEGIVPIVDMMEIADAQEDEAFGEQMKTLIRMAYEQPRYQTAEYQHEAAMEFANDIYLRCQRGL